MPTRFIFVLSFLCLLVAGISDQVKLGEPAGQLSLDDQYEQGFRLSDLRGSIVVLIDADNAGSQFSGVWGSAVRNRYKGSGEPRVAVVHIANLSSVPGFMKGYVRKKFLGKDSGHPNGRILLDWQGAVAERFGFRAGVSNVYVIDRDGILRYMSSGKGETADLEPLFRLIDEAVNW